MRPRSSVRAVKGDTPDEKFGNALKQIVSLPPEKAKAVRHHEPKHRTTTQHCS